MCDVPSIIIIIIIIVVVVVVVVGAYSSYDRLPEHSHVITRPLSTLVCLFW